MVLEPKNQSSKIKPAKDLSHHTHNADSTREALLAAALKLFAQRGLKATTVHEISQEAGVNVSLVSYHFNGKEGLFRACVERTGTTRLQMAENILRPPTSMEEFRIRLELFVEEMLSYHTENPDICTLLNRDLEAEISLIRDIFESTFLKSFKQLVEFFSAAKHQGILKDWTDPLLSAGSLFGAIVNITKNREFGEKYFGLDAARKDEIERIKNYLVRSILEGHAK